MKKLLLLAGVACVLSYSQANALEYTPYVSGKLAYSRMKNDVKIRSYDTDEVYTEKFDIKDWNYGVSVAAGVELPLCNGDAIRTELEYSYRDGAGKTKKYFDEGDIASNKMSVRNQNVMLNAYYDFNTGTKFTPYVGGGIGLAHLKASSKFAGTDGADYAAGKIKESSKNFAWNLAAGVGYEVNSNITVDLGYRYVDNGDLTKTMYTGDRFKVESEAHEILLGARFSF